MPLYYALIPAVGWSHLLYVSLIIVSEFLQLRPVRVMRSVVFALMVSLLCSCGAETEPWTGEAPACQYTSLAMRPVGDGTVTVGVTNDIVNFTVIVSVYTGTEDIASVDLIWDEESCWATSEKLETFESDFVGSDLSTWCESPDDFDLPDIGSICGGCQVGDGAQAELDSYRNLEVGTIQQWWELEDTYLWCLGWPEN